MDKLLPDAAEPGRYFLKSLHIDAFGGFIDRSLGPFSPGLNVVVGPNESGKTTTARFIGGVLFGWDEARGSRNAYRPRAGERSGSLLFESVSDPSDAVVCSRARNAEGMRQSRPVPVLGGVDRESFRTVFSLDGDGLRSDSDPEEVLDRLLTAGSGSEASPAAVAAEIEARMKACFSKAAGNPDSIPNIKARLAQASQEASRARSRDMQMADRACELKKAEEEACALRQALDRSNRRVEELARAHDALQHLEERGASAKGGACAGGEERAGAGGASKAALLGFAGFILVGVFLLAVGVASSALPLAVASAACFLAAACFGLASVLMARSGASAARAGHAAPEAGGAPGDPGGTSLSRAQAEALRRERRELCRSCGISEEGALRQLSVLLQRESDSREALQRRLLASSERMGELKGILDDAGKGSDTAALAAREDALKGKLEDAVREYAGLAVAREILEDALRAWEYSSQPAVYGQAGRLMSLMTQGRWCGVRRSAEGGICVADRWGMESPVRELSLGTCQQLHLALRIALLTVASGAGASLPVIADDILAGFDDDRRESAMLALADLARYRQVILFTCRSDTVESAQRASRVVNILRL